MTASVATSAGRSPTAFWAALSRVTAQFTGATILRYACSPHRGWPPPQSSSWARAVADATVAGGCTSAVVASAGSDHEECRESDACQSAVVDRASPWPHTLPVFSLEGHVPMRRPRGGWSTREASCAWCGDGCARRWVGLLSRDRRLRCRARYAGDGSHECNVHRDAGTNLLINPSFEEGTTLAGLRLAQRVVDHRAADVHAVDHDGSCRRRKGSAHAVHGPRGDDGTNKAEFYQGPVRGISPGQTVQFSLCVTGSGARTRLTKAYAIVGVEAFTVDKTYIADVSTNVTKVTKTPTKYTREYTVPDGHELPRRVRAGTGVHESELHRPLLRRGVPRRRVTTTACGHESKGSAPLPSVLSPRSRPARRHLAPCVGEGPTRRSRLSQQSRGIHELRR